MGYEKREFASGDTLYADDLNSMDEQIYKNTGNIELLREQSEKHANEGTAHITEADRTKWDAKQDKETTLAGYGITDGVTKQEFQEGTKNFITKAVNDLANYYLKSESYTRTEIDQRLSAIPKFSILPVDSLPTSGISYTTVYLLKTGTETDNLYTEYIYVNGQWEYLGKQTVDLTGYALKADIPTKISALTNDAGFITNTVSNLVNYYKKSEVYSKDEIDKKGFLTQHQDISGKADKATTLAGYGITDGATKTEVSKLSEEIVDLSVFVTPQMFGAKGDGTTDDTAAFKECFKHTNIFIPAGAYIISDTIDVLTKTNVRGAGRESTDIKCSADVLFNVQGFATFTDMRLWGNGTSTTGIVFPQKYLRIRNVLLRDMNIGIRCDNTFITSNNFYDCSFRSVNYPLYFPNCITLNTTVISNCEFNDFVTAFYTLGYTYCIDFDRCLFEGQKTTECYLLDTGGSVSVSFTSCYFEFWGKLISTRCEVGHITVNDSWLYLKGTVFLEKENVCDFRVSFINSTLTNFEADGDSFEHLIDGTNFDVDIIHCFTKISGTVDGLSSEPIEIKTAEMASSYGVATNCTVNGGYLTLETLPLYNGEVE